MSNGRRILVTGGAGFLGGAVCAELRRRGYGDLVVPRSREYDLVTERAVERLYDETRPDGVIHCAGRVGGIAANSAEPASFFYENLMMGALTMEHARRRGVSKYVAIGTVCSYPKFTPVPFREENLWDGYPEETNAPYGLAKKMYVVHAQALRQQYGFNAVTLLLVNLYGPGADEDAERSHVMPALIRKFREAKARGDRTVTVWGTGRATREFLHVRDAATGIVDAYERYDRPEPVNLGAGSEISIGDLARLIARLTGFEGEIVFDATKPDGQPRRCLDVTRAERSFGFRAAISLEDGLREMISGAARPA